MKKEILKQTNGSSPEQKAQYERPEIKVYEMELEGFIADSAKVGSMSYDEESWNEQ